MLENSDAVEHSSPELKVSSLNILFLNSPTQKQLIYNHIRDKSWKSSRQNLWNACLSIDFWAICCFHFRFLTVSGDFVLKTRF